jgi:dipeptidyl aminopeptidase/acylaminoacyl peptidase
VYKWKNEEDQRIIEGMLHYPPGKFETKNLPLLVLIHGGPNSVSGNRLAPKGEKARLHLLQICFEVPVK